jgi:hypothetical protein
MSGLHPHRAAGAAVGCSSLTEAWRARRSSIPQLPFVLRSLPPMVPCSITRGLSGSVRAASAQYDLVVALCPYVKKGELQYQRSYNLIPTLRAKRCRRAIDRWQYSHLDVMTVSGSPRSRRLPIDQIHLICDSSLTVPLSAKSQSRSMQEWEENG